MVVLTYSSPTDRQPVSVYVVGSGGVLVVSQSSLLSLPQQAPVFELGVLTSSKAVLGAASIKTRSAGAVGML